MFSRPGSLAANRDVVTQPKCYIHYCLVPADANAYTLSNYGAQPDC